MANKLVQLSDGSDNVYVQDIPYSTSETRIGTWIDGKPLYQITFNYSGTISRGTTGVVIGTITSDFETIVDIKGTYYGTNGAWYTLSPSYNGTEFCQLFVQGTSVKAMPTGTSSVYFTKAIATILYTKSTD